MNFPFIATGSDGVHTLPKGTELVQVIPFPHSAAALGGVVRAETPDEGAERERIRRNTLAGEGWYRRNARAARKAGTPAGA